jgi:trimethylamine--corrinoid protein Co-methyltransferase
MNLTNAALCGQNLIHDIGLIEAAKGGSQELIVICDEIIGMLRRMMRGVRVEEDTLAVDEIRQVAHGGSFLGLKHSLAHFNKEYRISPVMDRSFTYENWKKADGKTLLEKAQERVKKILTDHQVEPIPREARTQIERIKKEASKATVLAA